MASKKKKMNAVLNRARLMRAITNIVAAESELQAIKDSDERDALLDLVTAVKHLRAIANAPDGTPAVNLRGVARGALRAMDLEEKKGR